MSAQLQESTAIAVIPPKPPTVAERVAAVFSVVPSEEELKALATKYADITTITNQAGYDQVHAARMVLKNTRLEIARTGEVGREDAVQTSKGIIARQKALVAITQPEEERLQKIQDAWDDAIKAEKEAKIQAEIARVAEIQRRIDGIRNWPVNAANQSSILVGQMLAQAQAYRIDPDVFEEHSETATAVLAASVAALSGILQQRKDYEAEQERIIAERAELARLRAAEEARQAQARAEQAERERLAKIETDRLAQEAHDKRVAEAREHAEQIRREREVIEREAAENARKAAERQAELDAQAEAQRVANAAEAKRLADQQAEIDRQQQELRKAQEPAPIVVLENKVTGEALSVPAEADAAAASPEESREQLLERLLRCARHYVAIFEPQDYSESEDRDDLLRQIDNAAPSPVSPSPSVQSNCDNENCVLEKGHTGLCDDLPF